MSACNINSGCGKWYMYSQIILNITESIRPWFNFYIVNYDYNCKGILTLNYYISLAQFYAMNVC